MVYRPSDPLVLGGPYSSVQNIDAEEAILRRADMVFLVNEESRTAYAEAFPHIDLTAPRFHILPNGVDLSAFGQTWERPSAFRNRPTATYVGACPPSWPLILYCADRLPDVDFQIVLPQRLGKSRRKAIASRENLFHVPGVPPREVPRYVVNSDVIIVPYGDNVRLQIAVLHAKILQAMAARKPIVAIRISREHEQYGVLVAENYEDFLDKLRVALTVGTKSYAIDLEERDWSQFQEKLVTALGL